MPDYDALRARLDGPDYAGLDDGSAASRLNEPRPAGKRRVPIADIESLALQWGILVAIEDASTGHADDGVRMAARATIRLIESRRLDSVDTEAPAFGFSLNAMVAAGLMTGDQRAEIHRLGDLTTTDAIESFGVAVTDKDVAYVRSL